MKKIFTIFAVVSLLVVMVLSSCEKQELQDGNNSLNNDCLNKISIGELHNKSLSYIYDNISKDISIEDEKEMFEMFFQMTEDFLIQSNAVDSQLVKSASNEVSIMVNSILEVDTNSFEVYFEDYENIRNYTKVKNGVSDFFLDELEVVFIMSKDSLVTSFEVKEYVNSEFSKKRWKTEADIEANRVFVEVFNYSYDYWIGNSKFDDGTWVIIHDGMGALWGLAFSPVGSIILGTAFSAYSNEVIFAD